MVHRNQLISKCSQSAAHAYAPMQDTPYTPVIKTTGDDNGSGIRRLKYTDILDLKDRFDVLDIPLEERYLVLHLYHVTDLLREDLKMFKDLTDMIDSKPNKFAGFNILQFSKMPLYDLTTMTKLPFGSTPINPSGFASITFQSKEVMKVDGEIYMYLREDDPEERGTIVSFDKRFIALPIRNKGICAILADQI